MKENPPRILYFIWNPFDNGTGEVKWSTVNSEQTTLNQQLVSNSGSQIVSQASGTEWKIEARNENRIVSKIINISKEIQIFPRIKLFNSSEINVYSGDKITIRSEILAFNKCVIKKRTQAGKWESVLTIEEGERRKIEFTLDQVIKSQTEFWLNLNDTKNVEGNEMLNINVIEPLKISNRKEKENYNELIEKVKELIRKAKLTEAFEILMSLSAMIKGIEKEVTTLNFKKSSIEKDFILGLITYEEHKVENTRLAWAILKLIEEI